MNTLNEKFFRAESKSELLNAFHFMFKVKNMWILALISFLVLFSGYFIDYYNGAAKLPAVVNILFCLVTFIAYPLLYGYLFPLIRSLSYQQNELSLPVFNPKEAILMLFKFALAIGLSTTIFLLLILTCLINKVLGVFIIIVAFLIYIYMFPAVLWYFSHTQKITSFFQYNEIFSLIKSNKSRYFLSFVYFVVSLILLLVIIGLVMNNFDAVYFTNSLGKKSMAFNSIVPIVILSALGVYFMLVCSYICAKCFSSQDILFLGKNKS